jgi:hypothetical protein
MTVAPVLSTAVLPVTERRDQRMLLNVHLRAEILGPEQICRKANMWLLEHVGHLLRAEDPEIVIGEELTWRVTVALTSPEKGRIGPVGQLHLLAETGNVQVWDGMIEEFIANASALATHVRRRRSK